MAADQVAARASDRPAHDPWAVPAVPILARSAHDRMAERRTDPAWFAAAWQDPASRVLLISPSGRAPVGPGGRELRFVAPAEARIEGVRVLLGGAGGTRYLALLAAGEVALPAAGSDWRGLRELATELTDLDVGLLTTAVALQAWHQTHSHCPRCGTVTEVSKAGWTRTCPADGSEHFPRTDPAVIMLVHDGAGRCVLARGPQWPAGRMSVLAGFVEAGESAEAAVAREVREEVGIEVCEVTYVASQPHPFPASLMLGYTARVAGDPRLVIDAEEIVEAGWYTREQVRRTADWGSEAEPAGADVVPPALRGLPGAMSIARQLINAWLVATD
ncbi:NAD(+) diphosphatase [Jatrophihabitans sp.]|uniref:NAD(+) diphosphatase n=1 Tax=Jatrophihabitans sp. TaxID=1932789 RepID=UPI002BB34ED4|nr:NAD(+) diphosphatase [Jatrophihabitans sp.]